MVILINEHKHSHLINLQACAHHKVCDDLFNLVFVIQAYVMKSCEYLWKYEIIDYNNYNRGNRDKQYTHSILSHNVTMPILIY